MDRSYRSVIYIADRERERGRGHYYMACRSCMSSCIGSYYVVYIQSVILW